MEQEDKREPVRDINDDQRNTQDREKDKTNNKDQIGKDETEETYQYTDWASI